MIAHEHNARRAALSNGIPYRLSIATWNSLRSADRLTVSADGVRYAARVNGAWVRVEIVRG